jgi:purine-binding chemotaxis protein CheW
MLDDGVRTPAQTVCQKVLVFTLDREHFAVDIADAKEVLELARITKIPYVPGFIVGAMNLRGELLTVIDIRALLGLPQAGRLDEAKVIVTDVTGAAVGLLADTVQGTLDLPLDEIQKPLLTLDGSAQNHMRGQIQLADHILVLLDLKRLLYCDEINRLRGIDAHA